MGRDSLPDLNLASLELGNELFITGGVELVAVYVNLFLHIEKFLSSSITNNSSGNASILLLSA